jgi:hypothetical protein
MHWRRREPAQFAAQSALQSSLDHPSQLRLSSKQQKLLQRLQHQLSQDPSFFTKPPPETKQFTDKTQFDVLDPFRQVAPEAIDLADLAEYQRWEAELEQIFQKDLTVFLQEHLFLRHQQNHLQIDTSNPLGDLLVSCQKAIDKAKVLFDAAPDSLPHLIRYQRFIQETQQVERLQKIIQEILDSQNYQAISAGTVLGPTTLTDLKSQGLEFPAHFRVTQLHAGRLKDLHCQAKDIIFASPKFTLVMPANGYVHPGNLAYGVVYQLVSKADDHGQPTEWYLVSDHYYSQLSYEELQQTLSWWLPQKSIPTHPTEQILMDIVEVMPPEFTVTKPFEIFLSLASRLQKDAALPGGYSFAFEQNSVSQHIQTQEIVLKRAATIMTKVLLTEVALCQYEPTRQEYVSQILQDIFATVVIGLQHASDTANLDLEAFANNLELEVIGRYHEIYFNQKLGNDPGKAGSFFTSHSPHSLHNMAHSQVYLEQQKGIAKHQKELDSRNNSLLLGLATLLPRSISGAVSCAMCGGGAFGGLRGLQSANALSSSATSATSGSFGTAPWWSSGSTSSQAQNSVLGHNIHQNFLDKMGSWLKDTHHSAADAFARFSLIPASMLGTLLLTGNRLFDQLPVSPR